MGVKMVNRLITGDKCFACPLNLEQLVCITKQSYFKIWHYPKIRPVLILSSDEISHEAKTAGTIRNSTHLQSAYGRQ